MENQSSKNHIILHGIKENERSTVNLMEIAVEKPKNELNINLSNSDIDHIYRIGKKEVEEHRKIRPVLISLTNRWMKYEIIKNKKKLN
ncbi:unnamed protein product [Leptidea sinapis]|uniref:Uncharacterized protein n=1 Tax=Leptidea sinapis TaxID=189913 RepID=A0A5E4QKW2_9NEOP|nr:unnamed protein product [Leptidea sinapis]